MVLPITKLPVQILRTETATVPFPLTKDIKRLLNDMLATVKKADGIGLAAPQVGSNLNLALIYLEHMGIPPFAIFNPKITHRSKNEVEIEEGCLSMPGVFGMVSRPKKITVEFQDFEGQTHTITDDGWLARVRTCLES
jgi:peptide deformylase